jgi:dimethylhistidine N-methyltransferase
MLAQAGIGSEFAREVRAGLCREGQKELPCRYFYDEVGSALFEAITRLPEYGLTRADARLVRQHAPELVNHLKSPLVVAELGSGGGGKTRWVLEALRRREQVVYYPIDISHAALTACAQELAPLGAVVPIEADYLKGLREVTELRKAGEHLLLLFLGSTIGNFDRIQAECFLKEARSCLLPGDALLLGADLEKSVPRMLQAYDDPTGVTAAFNLNVLARINRELGGDFVLRNFAHEARYNARERRVEMHLRSRLAQTVTIGAADLEITLAAGETIWTESCHKFRLEEIRATAQRAGFRCEVQWVDAEWPFTETLLAA